MGLFGKKKADFVDLTDMKKRGIFRESSVSDESEDDVIDLSSSDSSSPPASPSGFGFLGNLASAGDSSESSGGSYTDKLRAARTGSTVELKSMQVKMEDIEYKLDRFLERLEKMEDKFGNV